MTYDDRNRNDPTVRTSDDDNKSLWAWVIGIALALILGWALFSVFSDDDGVADDGAIPAAGVEEPALPNVNPDLAPADAEPATPDGMN